VVEADGSNITIDHLRIVRLLGRGGEGHVYLARAADDQFVAVKVLANLEHGSPSELARFRREFRAAVRLTHPRVVRVIDAGIWNKQPYYTMEYVEGVKLNEFIDAGAGRMTRQARVSPERLRRLFDCAVQVLDALAYLHGQRVIHRDLKPSNILVTADGTIKLVDLGLAQQWPLDLRQEGQAYGVGSLRYMAPEQFSGSRPLDPRTDLYAFGAILYELLTGHHPFEHTANKTADEGRLTGEARPIERANPLVPTDLAQLVHALLRRQPEERPGSAEEVIRRLLEAGRISQPQLDTFGIVPDALPPPPLLSTGFIGRRQQLARLRKLMTIAETGRFVIGVISGESGVGKSRLLEEFTSNLPGREWRIIWPEPREAGVLPMRRAMELVRDITALLPDAESLTYHLEFQNLVEPLAPLLPPDSPFRPRSVLAVSVPANLPSVIRALAELLLAFGNRFSVMVILDDIHLFDEESRRFLRGLIEELTRLKRPQGHALMLVATEDQSWIPRIRALPVFPDEGGGLVERIELPGLSRDETDSLISRMTGRAEPPAPLMRTLHDASQGNPLFIREFISIITQEGAAAGQSNAAGVPIDLGPLSDHRGDVEVATAPVLSRELGTWIARRLRPFSARVRELLECAAVIGSHCEVTILREVADLVEEEYWEAVEEAVQAGVLRSVDGGEDWLKFSHPILRLGILGTLPSARAKLLHRRAFKSIRAHFGETGLDVVARLALHSFWGGDRLRAIKFNHHYALLQNSMMAPEARIYYERRALAMLDGLAREGKPEVSGIRLEALEMIATAQIELEDYREVEKTCVQLLEAARAEGAHRVHARAARRLGQLFDHTGRLADAVPFYQAALRSAREGDGTVEEADALLELGYNRIQTGDIAAARWQLSRALSLYQRLGNQRAIGWCLIRLGKLAALLELHAAAGSLTRAAVEIMTAIDDQRGLAISLAELARSEASSYQLQAALAGFGKAVEVCRNAPDPTAEAMARMLFARLLLRIGRFKEAAEMATRAIALSRDATDPGLLPDCFHCLGSAHLALNNPAEARGCFQRALDLNMERSRLPAQIESSYRLAEINAILDPAAALAAADATFAASQTLGIPGLVRNGHLCRGRILQISGCYDEAAVEFQRAMAVSPAGGVPSRLMELAANLAAKELGSERAERLVNAVRSAVFKIRGQLESNDRALFDAIPAVAALRAWTNQS